MLITTFAVARGFLEKDELVKAVETALRCYLSPVSPECVRLAVEKGLVPDTFPVPVDAPAEGISFSFSVDPLGLTGSDGRRMMYSAMRKVWRKWLVEGEWFNSRDALVLLIHEERVGDTVLRFYLPRGFYSGDTVLLRFSCLSSPEDLWHFSPYVVEEERGNVLYVEFEISPVRRIYLLAEILHTLRYIEQDDFFALKETVSISGIPPLLFSFENNPAFGRWGVNGKNIIWHSGCSFFRLMESPRVTERRVLFMMNLEAWRHSTGLLITGENCRF